MKVIDFLIIFLLVAEFKLCYGDECTEECVDFLIVGGGFAGLNAALRLQEYNKKFGTKLTYRVVEAEDAVGGRGIAAFFLSGVRNPLLRILRKEGGPFRKDFVRDDFSQFYYDVNGNPWDRRSIRRAERDIENAIECGEEKYLEFLDNPELNDISIRQALIECGWPTPAGGTLEETVEWDFIDFDLTASPETTGLNNFPFPAPVADVGRGTFYLKTPRAAAFIAEILASRIKNRNKNLLTGTTVTKIDWTDEKPIVHATATDETCYSFKAKRVLVTTSIGVLDRRGDCAYDPLSTCDPLFEPQLPEGKLNAIRELYIDENRTTGITGMGEYRPVRFQFGKAFWDLKRNYIAIDSEFGKGVFSVFQNLERKKLFPGQNAIQTFLVTQAYDEIQLQGGLDDERVNEFLEGSLGKTYPDAYFDKDGNALYSCTQIPPGRFPDPGLDLGPYDCVWSAFLEENELWYGAYSSWRVTPGNADRVDEKFLEAFEPLQPQSDPEEGEFVVWFTGAAYCDFHSEFVHGGYWSGALAINEMLDDMGLPLEVPLVETDEYVFCFGEE